MKISNKSTKPWRVPGVPRATGTFLKSGIFFFRFFDSLSLRGMKLPPFDYIAHCRKGCVFPGYLIRSTYEKLFEEPLFLIPFKYFENVGSENSKFPTEGKSVNDNLNSTSQDTREKLKILKYLIQIRLQNLGTTRKSQKPNLNHSATININLNSLVPVILNFNMKCLQQNFRFDTTEYD